MYRTQEDKRCGFEFEINMIKVNQFELEMTIESIQTKTLMVLINTLLFIN